MTIVNGRPMAGEKQKGYAMADRVKVGIVGLGRWARVLTRAAARSQHIEIAACFTRTESKRTEFARDTGVPAVPALAAMLPDPPLKRLIPPLPTTPPPPPPL